METSTNSVSRNDEQSVEGSEMEPLVDLKGANKDLTFSSCIFHNDDDNNTIFSDYSHHDDNEIGTSASGSYDVNTFKYKSQPPIKYRKRNSNDSHGSLSSISRMFELVGDKDLDGIKKPKPSYDERSYDTLTDDDVYLLVQEQLAARQTANFLKKSMIGLACFSALLTFSNFATSWASALLAQDTKTDGETSAMQIKGTNEVLGFQTTADTFELVELEHEERRSRRAMVLRELEVNPFDEVHAHRQLGKKKKNKNKNKKGKITVRNDIAFDNGKCAEKDLAVLSAKCNGSRTVNIKRKFRDGSYDIDKLCGPGTLMTVKGPKKCKQETCSQYAFSNPGVEDQDLVFTCEDEWCYSSGGLLAQGPGEPCDLLQGSDDCAPGLFCHTSIVNLEGTTGVCVDLEKRQKEGQPCDPDLSQACRNGLYCAASSNPLVTTGICTSPVAENGNLDVDVVVDKDVPDRQKEGNECNPSLGSRACRSGLYCASSRGSSTGICTVQSGSLNVDVDVDESIPDKQKEGEQCNPSNGSRACKSGLYCASSRGSSTGICTRTVVVESDNLNVDIIPDKQKEGEQCNPSNGSRACKSGLYCASSRGSSTGICIVQSGSLNVNVVVDESIPDKQKEGEQCNPSNGSRACKSGLYCASSRGSSAGICTRVVVESNNVDVDVIVESSLPDLGDACYFDDGSNACTSPYICWSSSGSRYTGICVTTVEVDRDNDPPVLPREGEACYLSYGCAAPFTCWNRSGSGSIGICVSTVGVVREDPLLPGEGQPCYFADGSSACAVPYSCLNSDGSVGGGAGGGGSGVGVGANAGFGVTISGSSGVIVTGNGGAGGGGAGSGGSATVGYCGVPTVRSSGLSGSGASSSFGAVISGPSGVISTSQGGSAGGSSGSGSGAGLRSSNGLSTYSGNGSAGGNAAASSGAVITGASGAISTSYAGAGYGQYCNASLGSSACANGYTCRSVGINGSDRFTCQ